MEGRGDSARKKRPLIAANILPPPVGGVGGKTALEILAKQFKFARENGFTHVWINPINIIPPNTVCHRVDLDTGLSTDMHMSLYAPDDPLEVRHDLPMTEVRKLIKNESEAHGLNVLVDFVWKHASVHSSLLAKHPKWEGVTVKDIIEYKLDSSDETVKNEIISHLKGVIDLYLNQKNGYGFSGLRIDAASHISVRVRRELFEYIRSNYPGAIILEECLFDRNQEANIKKLVEDSKEKDGVHSDFITSNLYYQKPNEFGALKRPDQMGDSLKLQLANNNGISFTGNHDHFSAGWSIVLSMAAQRILAKENSDFLKKIQAASTGVFRKDATDAEKIIDTIKKIAGGVTLPEEMDASDSQCIRYLLPFANEIARNLLSADGEIAKKARDEFRVKLFERIANRTIPSLAGYFVLYAELASPFESQSIFSTKTGKPLRQLLLTIEDLKSEPEITLGILADMRADKAKYDNFANFEKNNKYVAEAEKGAKKSGRAKGRVTGKDAAQLTTDDEVLRIWLPIIIEYLRNKPEKNKYKYYQVDPLSPDETSEAKTTKLQDELGTLDFIRSINSIYSALTTYGCEDYHTFTSQDKYKIIIRCGGDTTDVIILNLDPKVQLIVDDIDIQKIALWLQTRLYPFDGANLSTPFKKEAITYAPDGYAGNWRGKVGDKFDQSYTRVTGEWAGHKTNLFLGLGIVNSLSKLKSNFNSIKHEKSKTQMEQDLFHENLHGEIKVESVHPSRQAFFRGAEKGTTAVATEERKTHIDVKKK